jgi:hypothetical protein
MGGWLRAPCVDSCGGAGCTSRTGGQAAAVTAGVSSVLCVYCNEPCSVFVSRMGPSCGEAGALVCSISSVFDRCSYDRSV